MKTKELTGRALDYAVALAENHQSRCPWMLEKDGFQAWQNYEFAWGYPIPQYTEYSNGDDIIDREKIGTLYVDDGDPNTVWNAYHNLPENIGTIAQGTTRREAAMRAWVASKLGDEIELPEELK